MGAGTARWGLLALALAVPCAWGQDIRPSILSNSCNSCHGPGGHSPGAVPPIDGLPVETFVRAMQEFRSGERTGTIMGRLARGYTDAQIRAMAEYFSKPRDAR